MRYLGSTLVCAAVFLSGCAVPISSAECKPVAASCDADAPHALTVRELSAPERRHAHALVAASTLRRPTAYELRGSCAGHVASYLGGQVKLPSGDSFGLRSEAGRLQVIRHDGNWPPSRTGVDSGNPRHVAGYELLMADRVMAPDRPDGRRWYLGVFKRRSEYAIARFETLGAKVSEEVEVLIRSNKRISAVDYLPGIDTPTGQFGFVQPVGAGKTWVFSYDWEHGRLRPLKF